MVHPINMSDIYDGAFRTIVNDCKQFVLPFISVRESVRLLNSAVSMNLRHLICKEVDINEWEAGLPTRFQALGYHGISNHKCKIE